MGSEVVRKAVAFLAYDRFDYASLVLASLLGQEVGGAPITDVYDIWLFQDGFCADDPKSNRHGHDRIAQLFGKSAPAHRVVSQSQNLGVARHFDVAEKRLFRDEAYDFVVFCEDDLMLAPQYMATMDLMASRFADDRRVGMFSAHPANCSATLDEQTRNVGRFVAMDHNWGFGLTRKFWERRQSFVEQYLELLGDTPYRERPHRAIFEWLNYCGFEAAGSSQDYIKQCATVALGGARISTAFNLGLPIGRSGLHCSPDLFQKMGFDRTIVFRGTPVVVAELAQSDYARIFSAQSVKMKSPPIVPDSGIDEASAASWQLRVAAGEFNADRVLGSDWRNRAPSAAPHQVKTWSASDIPRLPHMENEGLELLRTHLAGSKTFLEFGAGGSTVLAAELGVETIISVESDAGFLDAVREAAGDHGGLIKPHPVDIGKTVEWGNPADATQAAKWPSYPSSVWQHILDHRYPSPDLVLIDGRFRAACCLISAMYARPGTSILFDDYFDRPHYHVVENYLQPVGRAGRMAHFVVPESIDRDVALAILTYSTDFR